MVDEALIKWAHQNSSYLYSLSSMDNVLLDVLINQTFWTSQSLNLFFAPLLDPFPFPMSVCNLDFVKRIRRIHRFSIEFVFFKMRNAQP